MLHWPATGQLHVECKLSIRYVQPNFIVKCVQFTTSTQWLSAHLSLGGLPIVGLSDIEDPRSIVSEALDPRLYLKKNLYAGWEIYTHFYEYTVLKVISMLGLFTNSRP